MIIPRSEIAVIPAIIIVAKGKIAKASACVTAKATHSDQRLVCSALIWKPKYKRRNGAGSWGKNARRYGSSTFWKLPKEGKCNQAAAWFCRIPKLKRSKIATPALTPKEDWFTRNCRKNHKLIAVSNAHQLRFQTNIVSHRSSCSRCFSAAKRRNDRRNLR